MATGSPSSRAVTSATCGTGRRSSYDRGYSMPGVAKDGSERSSTAASAIRRRQGLPKTAGNLAEASRRLSLPAPNAGNRSRTRQSALGDVPSLGPRQGRSSRHAVGVAAHAYRVPVLTCVGPVRTGTNREQPCPVDSLLPPDLQTTDELCWRDYHRVPGRFAGWRASPRPRQIQRLRRKNHSWRSVVTMMRPQLQAYPKPQCSSGILRKF